MKKTFGLGLVLLFAFTVLSASGAENQTSIAVYPIKAVREEDKATAAVLTSLMINELAKSSKLIVLEEAMLKQVMETQGLNNTDACDDTTCQVEVGRLVKTQNVLVCDLSKLGSRWLLTIKVTSIQTRAVVFSDRQECTCTEDTLDQLVAAAALKIRAHFGETEFPPPAPPSPRAVSTETGMAAPSLSLQSGGWEAGKPLAAESKWMIEQAAATLNLQINAQGNDRSRLSGEVSALTTSREQLGNKRFRKENNISQPQGDQQIQEIERKLAQKNQELEKIQQQLDELGKNLNALKTLLAGGVLSPEIQEKVLQLVTQLLEQSGYSGTGFSQSDNQLSGAADEAFLAAVLDALRSLAEARGEIALKSRSRMDKYLLAEDTVEGAIQFNLGSEFGLESRTALNLSSLQDDRITASMQYKGRLYQLKVNKLQWASKLPSPQERKDLMEILDKHGWRVIPGAGQTLGAKSLCQVKIYSRNEPPPASGPALNFQGTGMQTISAHDPLHPKPGDPVLRRLAQRAAFYDACRQSLEALKPVEVQATLASDDYALSRFAVTAQSAGKVKGARTLEVSLPEEGTANLELELLLPESLAFLQYLSRPLPADLAQKYRLLQITGHGPAGGGDAKADLPFSQLLRVAVLEGYFLMVSAAKPVQVASSLRVKDFMAEKDSVAVQVKGSVSNTMLADKRLLADGSVEITLHGLVEPQSPLAGMVHPLAALEETSLSQGAAPLTVTGYGFVPRSRELSIPADQLTCFWSAYLDGLRSGLMTRQGIKLDSQTTVENFMTTSDVIQGKAEGVVEPVSWGQVRFMEDGVCELPVRISLSETDPLRSCTTLLANPIRAESQSSSAASGQGELDWSSGVVQSTGIGAVNPKNKSIAQARIGAIWAAKLVAARNLLEIVQGVNIDSQTTVQNFMTTNDVIKTNVNGLQKGSLSVGSPVYKDDGTVETTFGLCVDEKLKKALLPPK